MKTNYFIAVGLLTIVLVHACEPLEEVSDVPEIQFKSLSDPYILQSGTITAYAADLTFTFIDGDSDIGVTQSSGTDTVNFIMVPFQKINGEYDSINADLYGQKYTIKNDERLDRNGKTVKGEILVQIKYVLRPPFDTMRYDFYLTDRAGNQSNIETTSDIAF